MIPVLDRASASERRDAWVSFATLLAVMAGYTTLETARDALFLASIPAERLPFAYLAVAVLAFVVTAGLDRLGSAHRREVLAAWLAFSAVLTASFYPIVGDGSVPALYALYAWGGVLTTVVLVEFWGILASRFTVVQAKRLFPFIGAGSVVGALLGTGLAGLLTTVLPARHLLLVAAGFLVLAAGLPMLFVAERRRDASPREARRGKAPSQLEALTHPYARRVAALVVLSTVTLTVVDFVFKSTVAEGVAPDELGAFFARIYFGLNVLSLVAQLFFVRFAIRVLTVTGALAVLPTLLALAALTSPALGALVAALSMKAADGGLRHSLHRTAVELLYVPMSSRVRASVKRFGDVVGQRGGQALASLLILGFLAVGAEQTVHGAVVVALSLLWLALAVRLRSSYLDLFRSTLREEARRTQLGFPDLDQESLENVVATLNSVNDGEVRAAMDLLANQGRARLVPALILYHPSNEVVVDALELLSAHGREDILPITDRLIERGDPPVRAASLRARVRLGAGRAFLERFVDDECVDVRATALVGLIAQPGTRVDEIRDALMQLADVGDESTRVAIGRAIAHRPTPLLFGLVLRLAEDANGDVAAAGLGAMRALPDAVFLDQLLSMLAVRALRPDVREVLVALGDVAFDRLEATLGDPEVPTAVRRHVPRTLMRFDPDRAAEVLLARFSAEDDRVVQHKILRALSFLQAREPNLSLSHATLRELEKRSLALALEFRDHRSALERDAAADPRLETRFHALLIRLLRDRERGEIDHAFRILALRIPDEDFDAIERGLASPRREVRASSTELLGALLEAPQRDAFIGLLEEPDGRGPLRSAGAIYRPRALRYDEVIQALLSNRNEALRGLAVYQAGVLGLRSLLPEIRALVADSRGGLLSEALRRVKEELQSVVPAPSGGE